MIKLQILSMRVTQTLPVLFYVNISNLSLLFVPILQANRVMETFS